MPLVPGGGDGGGLPGLLIKIFLVLFFSRPSLVNRRLMASWLHLRPFLFRCLFMTTIPPPPFPPFSSLLFFFHPFIQPTSLSSSSFLYSSIAYPARLRLGLCLFFPLCSDSIFRVFLPLIILSFQVSLPPFSLSASRSLFLSSLWFSCQRPASLIAILTISPKANTLSPLLHSRHSQTPVPNAAAM